jgi:hypothetical protein
VPLFSLFQHVNSVEDMGMKAIALNSAKLCQKLVVIAAFAALLLWSGRATASTSPDITIVSPADSTRLAAPFNVYARSATCLGQPVAGMGYSFDTSSETQLFSTTTVDTLALTSVGSHTLHIKSWGVNGSACVTDLTVIIYEGSPIPPTVTVASNLQQLSTWVGNNDAATFGLTTGTSALVTGPSLSGLARQYGMTFLNGGGEIFHVSFGADPNATHFIYDANVRFSSTVGLGNVETDMNQVLANGQTVIYGVQCDGFYQTWDYTINSGTPAAPIDTWVHSNLYCDPTTWAANSWHHIQIAYSRDAVGNVTYQSVFLDGVESDFVGATGNSAFALGWGQTLLTNLQFDGQGPAGAITAYLDNLAVYRW